MAVFLILPSSYPLIGASWSDRIGMSPATAHATAQSRASGLVPTVRAVTNVVPEPDSVTLSNSNPPTQVRKGTLPPKSGVVSVVPWSPEASKHEISSGSPTTSSET